MVAYRSDLPLIYDRSMPGLRTGVIGGVIGPGDLVQESKGALGIGRVVEIDGSNAVLEYVDLPARRTQKRTVPLEGIERVELSEETRGWGSTESDCGHGWLPGRVGGGRGDNGPCPTPPPTHSFAHV